jgi:hypothetical protein
LEETHELFEAAGFRDLQIYAIHKITHASPNQLLAGWGHNWWKLDRTPHDVQEITTMLSREIVKQTTEKGLKINRYTIFAHGIK